MTCAGRRRDRGSLAAAGKHRLNHHCFLGQSTATPTRCVRDQGPGKPQREIAKGEAPIVCCRQPPAKPGLWGPDRLVLSFKSSWENGVCGSWGHGDNLQWQWAERDIRVDSSTWLSSTQPCRGLLGAAGPVLPEFPKSTVWLLLMLGNTLTRLWVCTVAARLLLAEDL